MNTSKQKQRTAIRLARRKGLKEFAKKLEANTPKSELWFRDLYVTYKHIGDKYNSPFAGFIPDVINKTYKYIIEIDGSIHRLRHIRRKDHQKNLIFKQRGYKVIRIEAYDRESFQKAMVKISNLRGNYKPARILTRKEIEVIYVSTSTSRTPSKGPTATNKE